MSPIDTLWFLVGVWCVLPFTWCALNAYDLLAAIATRTLEERRARRQQRRERKAFEMLTHPAAYSKTARDFVSGEKR